MNRILHPTLLGLNLFLAVTAMAGGVGLLTGLIAPGTDLLAGSIFPSYVIPGLALLIVAGGSALLAAVAVGRRAPLRYELSIIAGMVIIIFELVEWSVIGYSFLQGCYLTIGGLIVILAVWLRARPMMHASSYPVRRPARGHGPTGQDG